MSEQPQFDEHTFRAEVYKFMGELRTYMNFTGREHAALVSRVGKMEERVASLESFRAKILGAIAAAGILGGGAGAGATFLLKLLTE